MTTGTVAAHLARHLRAMALRYGIKPQVMDVLPGMAPEVLADDLVRVPITSVWRISEMMMMCSEAAGVEAGAAAASGTLHSWDYLFGTGDSLADGFRAAARLSPAITDPTAAFEVVEEGRLLTVRYRGVEAKPSLPILHEFVMALIHRRVQDVTKTEATPVRVAFAQHRPPRSHRYLVNAFGTSSIEFDADATEITFLDPEAGGRPARRDPNMDQILTRYTETMIASAKMPMDWHTEFRLMVADALARDEVSLDSVAAKLLMSTRTLQRRLEERDTNWRDEVEAVRQEQALALLADTELTIGSIAARVGYADARTLRKAFVRWTGQTPDAYRRGARV